MCRLMLSPPCYFCSPLGPSLSLFSHKYCFQQRNLNSGKCLFLFSFFAFFSLQCLHLPSLNKTTQTETMGSLCLGVGRLTEESHIHLRIILNGKAVCPYPRGARGRSQSQSALHRCCVCQGNLKWPLQGCPSWVAEKKQKTGPSLFLPWTRAP